jgi:sigma-54 specific flagellar transcriptional regulator A
MAAAPVAALRAAALPLSRPAVRRMHKRQATDTQLTGGCMHVATAQLCDRPNLAGDGGPSLIYGSESPLRELEALCTRIAQSDATMLLTGETGSGKEVIGRLVHQRSARASGPFVPVNCAAIPESLLESELFGHARGAFTGASSAHAGRVALAEGGTLFLDEIGELPLSMQSKLLRLIQERVYEPVGSTRPVVADFRLVAATNRVLLEEVEAGRFRQDLYFRLLVCPVHLIPLRERRSDIPVLFDHFWELKGETRKVTSEMMDALWAYSWPGNVRELRNLVERLSVCVTADLIGVGDLPANMRAAGLNVEVVRSSRHGASGATASLPHPIASSLLLPAAEGAPSLPADLHTLLRSLEDRYIAAALAQAGGNKSLAAQLLGLQRTTLTEKLRRRVRVAPQS